MSCERCPLRASFTLRHSCKRCVDLLHCWSQSTDYSHVQIEVAMILAHRISAMQGAVDAVIPTLQQMQASRSMPEADWSKLRRLDFQDTLKSRNGFSARIAKMQVDDEHFEADVRTGSAIAKCDSRLTRPLFCSIASSTNKRL